MNSATLKKQRADFITSVSNYNLKYKSIINKIKQVDVTLDNSSDTLLYQFIGENNTKIIEKINNLLMELENDKQLTLQKIDAKIAQLEEQERLERERLEREKSEQNYNE